MEKIRKGRKQKWHNQAEVTSREQVGLSKEEEDRARTQHILEATPIPTVTKGINITEDSKLKKQHRHKLGSI